MRWQATFLLSVLASSAFADLYLHNPRGSNNRLNERSANRRNANRVFDSQNNNRGGYNVGDLLDKPFRNEMEQYSMNYFQSGPYKMFGQTGEGQSLLTVEWTNQHGCGGNEDNDPHKLNCNLVLQYMCQKDYDPTEAESKYIRMRNGVTTDTQNYNRPNSLTEPMSQFINRRANNVKDNRVLHESFEWYDKCFLRERNKGLFTADQKLRINNGLGYSSAIYTRQNPNGNRRGYECPEERDYYPYWHPTDWTDIAVLAENSSVCSYYEKESHNVQPKHECIEWYDPDLECQKLTTKNQCLTSSKSCEWWENGTCHGQFIKHWSRWNNYKDCTHNGGHWLAVTKVLETLPTYTTETACRNANGTDRVGNEKLWWGSIIEGKESACHTVPGAPFCSEAPWSRVNHLGNGRDAQANNFTWVLPYYVNPEDKRCVFRMRYNISTDDYDPYNTNASHNNNPQAGVRSPVTQNPTVTIGSSSNIPLRLAINTAQFGRTFQDRSHIFKMPSREQYKNQFRSRDVNEEELKKVKIFNLNVRGKRGNIVQVYPSVEYDFFPTELKMNSDDAVHIQWTGSNTHNNGAPGGDGQTGDAGEGTGGTDRHNMVQIGHPLENYPLPFENTTMWDGATVLYCGHQTPPIKPNKKQLAVLMASAGYYHCFENDECDSESVETKSKMNNLLNNAPASFKGCIVRFRPGTYHYICSRNNNFTNRSQKGKLMVRQDSTSP